jgi:chemotaxis protein histidine kinase CheA
MPTYTQAQQRAIYFFKALAVRTGAQWSEENSADVANWILVLEREIASKVARSLTHGLTQALTSLAQDGAALPTFAQALDQAADQAAPPEPAPPLPDDLGTSAASEQAAPSAPISAPPEPAPAPHQVTQRWDVRSVDDGHRLVREATEARRALRAYQELPTDQRNATVEAGLHRLVEVAERELHDYHEAKEALLGSTYATTYAQGATTHG